MNVDINKCVEVGDVGDGIFQNYFWQQVIYGFYIIGEFCGFKFWMWIVVWFFQFFDNVGDCWDVKFFIGEVYCFQVVQCIVIVYQIFQCLLGGGQNMFDYWVSFWVNGGGIQWVVVVVDMQEVCVLFKGFWFQMVDFQQLLVVLELIIFVVSGDDVLCYYVGQVGDVGQQWNGGGVQVNVDGVYIVFYYCVQFMCQLGLVDIVLILVDVNGFWVDFYQFGQGILQMVGDGDCVVQ